MSTVESNYPIKPNSCFITYNNAYAKKAFSEVQTSLNKQSAVLNKPGKTVLNNLLSHKTSQGNLCNSPKVCLNLEKKKKKL